MQRVKEKMGLELHLEHFQLRLGELGGELGGPELALLVAAIVLEPMGQAHHPAVHQHADHQILGGVEEAKLYGGERAPLQLPVTHSMTK